MAKRKKADRKVSKSKRVQLQPPGSPQGKHVTPAPGKPANCKCGGCLPKLRDKEKKQQ